MIPNGYIFDDLERPLTYRFQGHAEYLRNRDIYQIQT